MEKNKIMDERGKELGRRYAESGGAFGCKQ
jgi:hypothetical protein